MRHPRGSARLAVSRVHGRRPVERLAAGAAPTENRRGSEPCRNGASCEPFRRLPHATAPAWAIAARRMKETGGEPGRPLPAGTVVNPALDAPPLR